MPRKTRKTSPAQLGLQGVAAPEEGWWQCKGIFSTNYLRRQLLGRSEHVPSADECADLYNRIRTRWVDNYPGLRVRGEAYTRSKFLDHTLTDLGWAYMPDEALPACPTRKKPDYCLFPDEETERRVAAGNSTEIFRASASVVEAKKAGHSLDQVSKSETPGWFPSEQIQDYLRSAKDNAGRFFDWAVLTNGDEWRLYCEQATRDSHFAFYLFRDNTFCPLEEFRLFVALFRPQAFERAEGKCLLDGFRAESLTHQEALETNLRRRVFNVLEELAAGYYFNPENGLKEEDLPAVYDTSLIFLYRLLFVLYAESRGLLPARSFGPGYSKRYREDYSLVRLVDRLRDRARYDDDAFDTLHDELLSLFTLINGTNPRQNVAAKVTRYNGGLFDPEKHPSIERWKVGDKTLANVLRQLIFAQPPARGRAAQQVIATEETVDYGTLEVRQLGDIYEGLLGGHLAVRSEQRLELVDDEGKSHSEGVFYTPDWVVQYLVKEALRPLIDEVENSPEVQAALTAKSTEEKQNDSFAHGILNLNIVDPAMGSGHFLVRATDWLAEQIVYHPTTRICTEQIVANGPSRRSREEIEASGRIPVSPGVPQEQAETAYWRRRIVESCIYGVDINPLAVELAKLSLWLTCIAIDEPLNFLDHHLRDGDSLIYARPEEAHRLTSDRGDEEQLTADMGNALTAALSEVIKAELEIEQEASTRMEVVKKKEEQWKRVRAKLDRFDGVLDFWIAALEGLEVDGESLNPYDYRDLALSMLVPEKLSPNEKGRADELTVKLADQFAERKRVLNPFHWHLEFPSVFYQEDGTLKPEERRGFDAVLGNPPYISTHTSSRSEWRDVLQKRAGYLEDLYVHFTDLGFEVLLRPGGTFGFIVSDTFFTLDSKEPMRVQLQKNRLISLGQCDPFKATVDAAIFVARKEPMPDDDCLLFVQARYRSANSRPEDELPRLAEDPTIQFDGLTEAFGVRHGRLGCLRLHRAPVSIYRNALKRAFFEPRPAVLELYGKFDEPLKSLVTEWWERIEDAKKFAANLDDIRAYHRTLRPGDITLVGLIAEGGQGLRTANNGRFIGYLAGTPKAAAIEVKRDEWTRAWLADQEIGPVFRELLIQNGGNPSKPTEDGAAWEACVEPLKNRFPGRLGLGRMDLYRIVPSELVATAEDFEYAWRRRKAELLPGWQAERALDGFWAQVRTDTPVNLAEVRRASDVSDADFCTLCHEVRTWVDVQRKSGGGSQKIPKDVLGLRSSENYTDPADAPRIATIYNGLSGRGVWVPFRKGDPEGNRWLDNEPLYIDWSADSVSWLSGAPEARWQGHRFLLTPGLTYTLLGNHAPLKAKLQEPCVFDASASRLTPIVPLLPPMCLLAVYNSNIFSHCLKKFIKNTAAFEIGDVRMTPVVIPAPLQAERLSRLAQVAIEAKRLTFTEENPPNELVDYARKLGDDLTANAPAYLRPSAQLRLLETAADCLATIELAVNWEAEKLYGVEGKGPFDEF